MSFVMEWISDRLHKANMGTSTRRSPSPLLFVLCMERLGHLIQAYVDEGAWKALKASRNGPRISYLFFVDDLLLFAEAGQDQVNCIKDCLDRFCST